MHGFLNAELIREGDRVLDLACGDGFFTRRFHSIRAAHVDAIDFNSDVLQIARIHNSAANISFFERDIIQDHFPAASYEVAIWDAAINYFCREDVDRVLHKIRAALKPGGVCVGSVPMASEAGGYEHRVFFKDVCALDSVLREHFEFRAYKVMRYALSPGAYREEIYWRCGTSRDSFHVDSWETFAPTDQT